MKISNVCFCCGLCIPACPWNAIRQQGEGDSTNPNYSEEHMWIDQTKCAAVTSGTACRECIEVCSVNAITK